MLSTKNIFVLDEHPSNEHIVNALKKENNQTIKYQIWDTDHSFTNKRSSLIRTVLDFVSNDLAHQSTIVLRIAFINPLKISLKAFL